MNFFLLLQIQHDFLDWGKNENVTFVCFLKSSVFEELYRANIINMIDYIIIFIFFITHLLSMNNYIITKLNSQIDTTDATFNRSFPLVFMHPLIKTYQFYNKSLKKKTLTLVYIG